MTATRTISVLLKIMADVSAPIRQRIQAAENLLTYEAPEEVIARTKSFLLAIIESKHVALSDRLEATKLMRKAESPRITQQTVRTADEDQSRERGRDLAITNRRLRLDQAGLWPCPAGWHDDLLADDYEPEPVAPCTVNDLITALQRRRAERSNGIKRRRPKLQPSGD